MTTEVGRQKGRKRYHVDTKSLRIPNTGKTQNLRSKILLFSLTRQLSWEKEQSNQVNSDFVPGSQEEWIILGTFINQLVQRMNQ